MANKADYVSDSIYNPFKRNPVRDRQSFIDRFYVRNLTEIAVNRFKWIGLPDTVDKRFLEMTLFHTGLAVFYYDTEFDRYMALRSAGRGPVNMYDNPTGFHVYGNFMVQKELAANVCVPIWHNSMRMTDMDVIYTYAPRLANIDRSLEVALVSMRHPVLIAMSDTERQSMMNAWRQVQEGQPVIFGTQQLMSKINESISVFNMGIDSKQITDLLVTKTRVWSEAMMYLGINQANQDKKERLVSAEVSANDSQIMMIRNGMMNARRYACEQINAMYGLQVSVEWNDDTAQAVDLYSGMEGGSNGNVHDSVE